MRLYLFLFLIVLAIAGCKKEEKAAEPKTLTQAGIVNEIDSYKPGTCWVYNWTEFDYSGLRIAGGTDTIKVVAANTCDSCRQVAGTVHGANYSATYFITQSQISYQSVPAPLYYLQGNALIPFDSTDVRIDYPINSSSRGCTSSIQYTSNNNIPVNTLAGNFVTIQATQRTVIAGSTGGCSGGFETINYARGLGEVYRTTSHETNTYETHIHYTRELIAYKIAY